MAVGGERDAVRADRVLKRRGALPRLGVPQPDAVGAGPREYVPVRAESHRVDGASRRADASDHLPVGHGPQADLTVVLGRGQHGTTSAEGEPVHRSSGRCQRCTAVAGLR